MPKDDPRIEAYGTIDELNSFVGQAVFLAKEADFEELHLQLVRIQHELFDCGSDLAYARPREDKLKVSAELVDNLEVWLDAFEEKNPPLERFILPGGSALSSPLHVCRTVCRRAERLTVSAANHGNQSGGPPLFEPFVRLFLRDCTGTNVHAGIPDVEYERSGKVFR